MMENREKQIDEFINNGSVSKEFKTLFHGCRPRPYNGVNL